MIPKPCPFCGTLLAEHPGTSLFHPGLPGDRYRGGCLLSGQGYLASQIPQWNRRTTPETGD